MQISEINFYDADGKALGVQTVLNPGGNNPENEGPEMVVDGSTATKWLDWNSGALVFQFALPVAASSYSWTTANDIPARDPVKWVISGSNDMSSWVILDSTHAVDSGHSVTSDRRRVVGRLRRQFWFQLGPNTSPS